MKIKVTSFFQYIIAFCIILDCETVWKWMDGSGYFKLAYFCLIIGALFILLLRENVRVSRNNATYLIYVIGYSVFFLIYNLLFNSSHAISTIQIILVSIGMLLYFQRKNNILSVLDKCSNLTVILAVTSLLFWFFGSIIHLINPNKVLIIYTNNIAHIRNSFYYLHYEMQIEEIFKHGIYRNTGIFYESPKYVLLLSTMLAYELFIKNKPSFIKSIVFTITTMTTMAMTGINAVALIWFFYILFMNKKDSKIYYVYKFLLGTIFIILGVQIIPLLLNLVLQKTATASFNTRMDNYRAGYLAWKAHPLIGDGYLNMGSIIENYSSFRLKDIGYSNSVFRVLSQGGILLSTLYLFPILKAFKYGVSNKNYKLLSFIVIFIFFLITTSFPYNYICIIELILLLTYAPTWKRKSYISINKDTSI